MYGNIRTKNQRPTVRRAKNTRSNPKIQRRGTHKELSTTTRLRSDKRKTTPTRQANDGGNKKIRRTTKRQNSQKGTETPKKRNKKMFRHITKAGMDFQDAIFNYMADFIYHEMVPE